MPFSRPGYPVQSRNPMGRARQRALRKKRFVAMIMKNKAMNRAAKKKAIDSYTGFEK